MTTRKMRRFACIFARLWILCPCVWGSASTARALPAGATSSGNAVRPAAAASVAAGLDRLASTWHARVVAEVPASPDALQSMAARLQRAYSLAEAAGALGASPVVVHGITVLEPGMYPPLNEEEAGYRAAMTGVAKFVEALPEAKRQIVDREEWLDVSDLPALQQARVQAAGMFSSAGEGMPPKTGTEQNAATGFIFDPYVQVLAADKRSPRYFFRSWYRVPQFERLKAGPEAGSVEAAAPGRHP